MVRSLTERHLKLKLFMLFFFWSSLLTMSETVVFSLKCMCMHACVNLDLSGLEILYL